MPTLYHHWRRKSNITSQKNTAEKIFQFHPFFWQTDEIRPIPILGTEKDKAKLCLKYYL